MKALIVAANFDQVLGRICLAERATDGSPVAHDRVGDDPLGLVQEREVLADHAGIGLTAVGAEHYAAVLTTALRSGVHDVGLVASLRRGSAVLSELDVPDELRGRVRTPAGLNIGARTPMEVAVSIVAELISVRPVPSFHPDRYHDLCPCPREFTWPHHRD